jgi:plasmid segregation protein ParM
VFKIAIDLGHGYIKGMSESGGTVIFPSLVGEGYERKLNDVFAVGAKKKEYEVVVDGKRYFVGSLAAAESWDVTRALDESRLTHYSTPVLYGTAAALLLGNMPYPVHLAAGLPFELFKTRKEELRTLLDEMRLDVEVVGVVRKRPVCFDSVTLAPQAAGAFYSAMLRPEGQATEMGGKLLKEGGVAAIVDSGFKTTDFMLVDLGSLDIVESMCGTINMAMNDVFVAAQRELQQEVRDVVDLLQVEEAFARGRFWFKGKEYPVKQVFTDSVEGLAETVADRLRTTWKDRQKYIRVLFLAGGGATALAPAFLRRNMPVEILPDAQFANARGFLGLAARREAVSQKARPA